MNLEGKSGQLRDFSIGSNDVEEAFVVGYKACGIHFFISETESVDG